MHLILKVAILLNIMFLHRCQSQETEVTSTPTRPVENVLITTKGLQDRNNLLLDKRTVENKGKLKVALHCRAETGTLHAAFPVSVPQYFSPSIGR